MKRLLFSRSALLFLLALSALPAHADEGGAAIDTGDTAWLLVSTGLVLFMMIPGLAMFYGGLVRSKNILSVFMQCFALTAVMSVLWVAVGYSLSFTDGGAEIGGWGRCFLGGLTPESVRSGTAIPELLFAAYQMMFFLITPGLFIGAFAERMRFSAVLLFSIFWGLLVYAPICYAIWYKANFFGMTSVIDLAGGIVVHITAGVAALVACIMVGVRKGFPEKPFVPHNLPITIVGAAMLWVGWFGFNAGAGLKADGAAAMTLMATHISASTACIVWMLVEWIRNGKPSVLGIATGAIAGLAAITPAAGYVGVIGAMCIGGTSSLVCWLACAKLKARFKYDDSLDVFGVHGVGGFVGTTLVAVFGAKAMGGLGDFSIGQQLGVQLLASLIAIVWSGLVSFGLLKAIDKVVGLRVDDQEEELGLDMTDHGENAYNG